MAWCLIIEWNHTETHGISTSIHFLFLLCFHSQYIVRLTIFVIISIHAVYPVHGLYIPRRTPFSYHTDMAKCAHGGNDYFTIVWMKMAEHNKRFASMQLKLQFCSSFFFYYSLCHYFVEATLLVLVLMMIVFIASISNAYILHGFIILHRIYCSCYLDILMFVVLGWTKRTSSTISWIHYFHLFAFFLFRPARHVSSIVFLCSP